MSKELVISAGGKSSRIRSFLDQQSEGMPKHLLNLPNQHHFLLGRIIESARNYFESIRVSASSENIHFLQPVFESSHGVRVEVDQFCSGPLGPLVRSLLEGRERAYGCAGDFYCQFSWKEFERFHDSHERSISILVAQSAPTKNGAKFNLNNQCIDSWERLGQTNGEDLINIGAYIIDYDKKIIPFLESMQHHKEDPFFDELIPLGHIAGYNPGVLGFNVNTYETYVQLCQYLSR